MSALNGDARPPVRLRCRRPVRTPFLAAALLCLAPAGLLAQSYSDPGFGVGVHIFRWVDAEGSTSGQLSGGIHSRYRLTGGLGFEVALDFRITDYDLDGQRVFRLLVVPLTGSLEVFLLPRSRIQPYLLGGAGYYFIQGRGYGALEELGTQTENRFGFHGGAGIDFRPSRRTSVHVDWRYVVLESNVVPDGPGPAPMEATSPRADFWLVTAGLTVYF